MLNRYSVVLLLFTASLVSVGNCCLFALRQFCIGGGEGKKLKEEREKGPYLQFPPTLFVPPPL